MPRQHSRTVRSLLFSTHDELNELGRRGHGNSYRYHVYSTPRLNLMEFQMTWNHFFGCFCTKWSNARIRKGLASKSKCEMSSISTPKWITMASSRVAEESFSVSIMGSSTKKLSGISSKHHAGRLSGNCGLFSVTSISLRMWRPISEKRLASTAHRPMKTNGGKIYEFEKPPRSSVCPNGFWRESIGTCPPHGMWMTTVVYARQCFFRIRPRARIAASVRLMIELEKT